MLAPRVPLAIVVLVLAVAAFAIAIVVLPGERAPSMPTVDAAGIRTQAVSTFIAESTQTALALPTRTPTRAPIRTATPTEETAGSETPICLGLRFIRDVSIPDNTEMTPAEVFTKTWLVENSGACPWKPGFQVVLIGGLAMGASPFEVARNVGPGGSIQVSMKMVAPTNQTGVVQGTWKMADANGVHFGDFLSVVIVVDAPAETETPLEPTSTP
jgi:next-to-BRCA1 protein 1